MIENLHILQVKNLRKYPYFEWINLHTIVDLSKFQNIDMALEVELRGFEDLRKERDDLPLEFRFVKIKVNTDLNVIPMKNGEEILNKIKKEEEKEENN